MDLQLKTLLSELLCTVSLNTFLLHLFLCQSKCVFNFSFRGAFNTFHWRLVVFICFPIVCVRNIKMEISAHVVWTVSAYFLWSFSFFIHLKILKQGGSIDLLLLFSHFHFCLMLYRLFCISVIVCELLRFSFMFIGFIIFCRNENVDENQRTISFVPPLCFFSSLVKKHTLNTRIIYKYMNICFIFVAPKAKIHKCENQRFAFPLIFLFFFLCII